MNTFGSRIARDPWIVGSIVSILAIAAPIFVIIDWHPPHIGFGSLSWSYYDKEFIIELTNTDYIMMIWLFFIPILFFALMIFRVYKKQTTVPRTITVGAINFIPMVVILIFALPGIIGGGVGGVALPAPFAVIVGLLLLKLTPPPKIQDSQIEHDQWLESSSKAN